jgi:hypothetical protein
MSLDAVRSLAATLLPLDSLADRRRRSADWRVLVDGSIDLAAGEKLARQWDALRIDGYADAQVVASFGVRSPTRQSRSRFGRLASSSASVGTRMECRPAPGQAPARR